MRLQRGTKPASYVTSTRIQKSQVPEGNLDAPQLKLPLNFWESHFSWEFLGCINMLHPEITRDKKINFYKKLPKNMVQFVWSNWGNMYAWSTRGNVYDPPLTFETRIFS